MCELSAADGFVEINENVGDMIKYVANEPSVGLYYIQQHAQNAVPNVIRLKNTIKEKSHDVSLHTEDLEDSIAMTKSMKACGPPIIEEMIRDIKTSLTIMSTKQPVRGVIHNRSPNYQVGTPGLWRPVNWARSAVRVPNDGETGGGYFSTVLKSAKEKAGNLKWPQLDYGSSSSTTQQDEADELPVSSQVEDETVDGGDMPKDDKLHPGFSSSVEFDEFKADREARLEEWLKGTGEAEGHHVISAVYDGSMFRPV